MKRIDWARCGAHMLALVITLGGCQATAQGPKAVWAGKVGLELDGNGDGSRSKPFVDLAKTHRRWTLPNFGPKAKLDANGWPTCDAETVLFDIRPFGAWAPPIDDPDGFMPDWSGVYSVSFKGQAQVSVRGGALSPSIRQASYNPATNTTTCKLVVPKGEGLVVLTLTNTKRTASSPVGSGITSLKVIRPGYDPNTKQLFTKEFLEMLRPFKVLRYMNWLDTNHNPGYYGDTGHHALEWKDRRTPDYATQSATDDKYGVAWEYIVQLANLTNTDAWINIPVAATDGYVRELAKFLKVNLENTCTIYIEHSNEVWNFGFPQYIYNKLAAIDEVKSGKSVLNNDGVKDEERYAHRRHAKRLHDIAMIFADVFGKDQLNKRIRPVYASWVIMPDSHYKDVLAWCEKTYGPVKNYFYSIAVASYYNDQKASKTSTPDEVLDAMFKSSDEAQQFLMPLRDLAKSKGLKFMQYEIGPDNGGGDPTNVANRIRANRLPRMKELIMHDAKRWFAIGGDLYMYFAGPGAYSRHGCWGLSEDVADLNTPKWQAIYELTGFKRQPKSSAVWAK